MEVPPNPRATSAPRPTILSSCACPPPSAYFSGTLYMFVAPFACAHRGHCPGHICNLLPALSPLLLLLLVLLVWCSSRCCNPLISGVRANPCVQINEVRALLEDLDHSPPLAKDVKYEPPSHPLPHPPSCLVSSLSANHRSIQPQNLNTKHQTPNPRTAGS